MGFSFSLSCLPGSTGSIKLQQNAPPTTPAERCSATPRHLAFERDRGWDPRFPSITSKRRETGSRKSTLSTHSPSRPCQAGVKGARGRGKEVSVFLPAAGIVGPTESHRTLRAALLQNPDRKWPGEKPCVTSHKAVGSGKEGFMEEEVPGRQQV